MITPAYIGCEGLINKAKGCLKPALALLLLVLIPCCSKEHAATVRIIGLSDASRAGDFREVIAKVPGLKLISLDGDKATATLEYDAPVLLNNAQPAAGDLAPGKILSLIDRLVGEACTHTFSVTAPTGIAENKLTRLDLKVGLNDCKGCRYAAYIAIAKLDGVERAGVDSNNRVLTAWIDPAKTSKETLETALTKARVKLRGK